MLHMISKEKQKYIRSLHKKKSRQESGVFLVEWEKSLIELLWGTFVIKELFVTEKFAQKFQNTLLKNKNYQIADSSILEKISINVSNNSGIAIVESPQNIAFDISSNELAIALDTINDPGNLGTIIRICDWYGIKKIIASKDTVELTNPKVIASTMGSIWRVQIYYTNLEEYFSNVHIPIFWAFLKGENVHNVTHSQKQNWIIVIGNESHGISTNIEKYITQKITIPCFWSAESLNAWVACGIIIDNFMRNN